MSGDVEICDYCGTVGGCHYFGCKIYSGAEMKRSTTEDYPPVSLAMLQAGSAPADAQLARDIEAARGVKPHASDCAVYNEPAYPAGPCDCGATSALQRQEGGSHYTKLKIQPIEYSMMNDLNAGQHTVVKYVTRYQDKGGIADLRKAIHTLELMIEIEQRKNSLG